MAVPCQACGAELRAEDRYCSRCGTAAEATPNFCSRCGSPLDEEDKFCRRCGQSARRDTPKRGLRTSAVGAAPDDADEEWLEGLDFDDVVEVDSDAEAATAAIPPQAGLSPAVDPGEADATQVLPPGPAEVRAEASRTAAARPSEEPPRQKGFPIGATLALFGALAVAASAFLDWTPGLTARDIPARFLLEGPDGEGGKLAVLLIALGAVGAAVALVTMAIPFLRILRRLAGLLSLAVPVLFVLQLLRADGTFPDDLGIGIYVAGAGALVQVVAGRWFRR